jgi:PAS domain S-box-containing protein
MSNKSSTKEIEHSLIESQARLAGIVHSATDGIIAIDHEHRIILFNPAAERVFGYNAQEMLGQPLDRLLPNRFRHAHEGHIRGFAHTSVTDRRMGALGSLSGRRANGEEFPLEASISQVDIDGHKVFTVILRDITERKRSEEALREQAELLDLAHGAIMVRNLNGTIRFWSHGAEEMYGYSKHQAAGRVSHELLGTVFPQPLADIEDFIEQEGRWEGELTHTCKDGKLIVVASRWTLRRDKDGSSNGVMEIDNDITERKQAEETKLRLAAIVTSSQDAIIGKTLDGIITSWNPAAETLFGYTAEEAIGNSMLLLFPAGSEEEEIGILASIRHGERVEQFETVRVRKDGHRVNVSVVISPVTNNQGKIVGASKIARDITEQKQAEQKLKASENRYRRLFESAKDGILILNAETAQILDVNPFLVEMLGYSHTEFLGKKLWEVGSFKDIVDCQSAFLELQKNQTIRYEDLPLETADGRRINVEFISSVYFVDDHKLIQCSIRDVTERRKAEEALQEAHRTLEQRVVERTLQLESANRELEAFSYSVSHDLRAPLRAINGFAGIVCEDFGPQLPEEAKGYLQRIRRGGEKMGCLIDDLLAFSQLSRQPMNRRTVDMARLVRAVLEEQNPQSSGHQVEIKIENLPECHGDAALLKQVWMNLLSNAVKYSRGRALAVVEIGCTRETDQNVYFVRDNGAGFDMTYAHKLFGVFQRLHHSDEFEGTGVGLAIVQRVVFRHGGRVWAEAKVDRGATFFFTVAGEDK